MLKDGVEERTVNYNGIASLTDLQVVTTEMLRKVEFDSQLFLRFVQIMLAVVTGRWRSHKILTAK